MSSELAPWLRSDLGGWLAAVGCLPDTDRAFLEVHLDAPSVGIDFVFGLDRSSRSLSPLITGRFGRDSQIWAETISLLSDWRDCSPESHVSLWSSCLSMWLEFDAVRGARTLSDPSIFIALTPGTDVRSLSEDLWSFPDLAVAASRFGGLAVDYGMGRGCSASFVPFLLGHIGYMSPRQSAKEQGALRSCWRCEDCSHLLRMVDRISPRSASGQMLRQGGRLAPLFEACNSMMLDLDSADTFSEDFSVEFNVFSKDPAQIERTREAAFGALRQMSLMSEAQAKQMVDLTGLKTSRLGHRFYSLPHHIKVRFAAEQVLSAKVYLAIRPDTSRARASLAQRTRLRSGHPSRYDCC